MRRARSYRERVNIPAVDFLDVKRGDCGPGQLNFNLIPKGARCMPTIHFLNVLEGDCNIIQHISNRVTVIDVSNAYNDEDTPEEKAVKASREREEMRKRTNVPSNKIDYRQKHDPDNPIVYLKEHLGVQRIFRFVISGSSRAIR